MNLLHLLLPNNGDREISIFAYEKLREDVIHQIAENFGIY